MIEPMPPDSPSASRTAPRETARRVYLGESGRIYHGEKRALPPSALPWVIRLRAERFREWVRPTDSVLEIGCGAGWNLAGLTCARRVGSDVAVQLKVEVESVGVEFVASTEALPDHAFHLVICHHALEHVADPLAVLEEAWRLVSFQGVVLLTVPYEREARYRRFDPSEPNHHLFSWNPQTLGNLATIAGFSVERIGLNRYGYDRRAALWAVRAGFGEHGFRLIRQFLQRMRPLQEVSAVLRPIDRLHDGA